MRVRARVRLGPAELIIEASEEAELSLTRAGEGGYKLSISLEDLRADAESEKLFGGISDLVMLADPLDEESGKALSELRRVALRRWIADEVGMLFRDYGELARELLLKPEYFVLARYVRKAHMLVVARRYYGLLGRIAMDKVDREALSAAVKDAIEEGVLDEGPDGLVRPGEEAPKRKAEKLSLRSAFRLLKKSSKLTNVLSLVSLMSSLPGEEVPEDELYELMLMRTDRGLVPVSPKILTERLGIQGKVRRLGGIINVAYLVETEDGARYVIKRFHDWSGLKWIPLALWAMGVCRFDTDGRRRLSNEYRMNRALKDAGFDVPSVIHVDLRMLSLTEEYIEGRTLRAIMQDIISRKGGDREARCVERCAEELGRLHESGFTMGDANPTNFIITGSERVFFVDLEQARKGGDPAWDIATIVFFAAHYVQGLDPSPLRLILRALISGYLKHGDPEDIREALGLPYLRVYAPFAYPHVLVWIRREIERLLREAGGM